MATSGIDWASKIPQAGVHTVTAGQQAANVALINTDNKSAVGFFARILRAGVDVTVDAVITLTAGVLSVADGGATYSVTAADVVHYIIF